MIAANIGKIFLKAYNEKYKSSYSAKEFFIEKYYPLFFDHEKYMQWVTNSPFVQGIKKGMAPTAEERKQKLVTLEQKIEVNEADASIAIGFPSLDIIASTSGQITNLNMPFKEEDVYCSWIGGGLGVGIQSGLSLLFSNEQILLHIYEGWAIYRDYLNNMPSLRGNQINTWNGQWISHRYNKITFDEHNPTASFDPFRAMSDGGIEVSTQSWTNVMVAVARSFSNEIETAYVYSLGQTNITVGFIPFELPRIRQPYELFDKYFGTHKREQVEQLFGTAIGFTKACQMGAVGVNALEPKGFRDCLDKGVIPKYNEQDEEKKLNFNTYQIWLLAMLNNEQLWEKAQQVATILNTHSMSDTNARKVRSQEVANLLSAVNKKQFIEELTTIVKNSQFTDDLTEVAALINSMPIDNVPYFLTLIRFHFAVANKKS
ncbi:hypothetical protein LJC57_04940 [Parabacteroides sp. OttesenSCG-928-G07]|nr:hypothetical protein [Parabacteroides sp. OttesenSCG-928-G07]